MLTVIRKEENIVDAKEKVLEVMKNAGKPLSAGEVEKISGLDRKEIDQAFKQLKKENAIISPVRCKWEPVQ
jgi:predicted transcriptional regulator